MGLETTTDVDKIDAVQDRNGNLRPAATADLQEQIRDYLAALRLALASQGDDELRITAPSTLPVEQQSAVAIGTWSAGTLSVQEDTALDVSGATVPVEQQSPVGVENSSGAQVDPATEQTQSATNDRLGNFGSGDDGDATDDTTGSTLPAGAVPEGVEVVVQAKHGNTSRIKVGLTSSPTVELKPGQASTFRVDDRSQVNIVAKSSGDGVNYTHEVSV